MEHALQEQEEWDEKDWPEDGTDAPVQQVDAEAVNRWLFNEDTVDKMLAHLMTRGQKVAGGDELGKTIIFAKNRDHADFISARFDANYPHRKGEFGLPTELELEPEEAKRFDLLIIRLQLAVMKKQKSFTRWRDQVTALAGALLEMASIPMVRAQLPLIEELLSEPWWQDVTVPMLEVVRRRLRLLVPLIDKVKRAPVYTDFEDELGEETEIQLTELSGTDTFERFRVKARSFLREHADMLAIHKLRTNTPLTKVDLDQLQTVLTRSGVGATEFVQQAAAESHGLGLFVRCLEVLARVKRAAEAA